MKQHPLETTTRQLLERLYALCNPLYMEHPVFSTKEASALLGAVQSHLIGAEVSKDMMDATAEHFGDAVVRSLAKDIMAQLATPREQAFQALVDRMKRRFKTRAGYTDVELSQEIARHEEELERIRTGQHQRDCDEDDCAPYCSHDAAYHDKPKAQQELDAEDMRSLRAVVIMITATVERIEDLLGEMSEEQRNRVGSVLMSFHVVARDKWQPRPGKTWEQLAYGLGREETPGGAS